MKEIRLYFKRNDDICDMLKDERFISYINDGLIDVLYDPYLNELSILIKIDDWTENRLMFSAIVDLAYYYAYYN